MGSILRVWPETASLDQGQRDRGVTIDSPAGRREMQTLRKLPTIGPKTPSST